MLAGYLPFDDDPANPEGDNINLLYKYIVTTPLTFPEYVTPHARDLLRRILVPNPRKRADLFEVARHSWLSEYAQLVEFITSSTTLPSEVQNSSAPPANYGDAPLVSRSASVRESTKQKQSHPPVVGGLSKTHGNIDPEAETNHRTPKDAKRRTVQVEYVAPTTQTQRGAEGSTPKTHARSNSQIPVATHDMTPSTDKPLPREPPVVKDITPKSATTKRPPVVQRNTPPSRAGRDPRVNTENAYIPNTNTGARPHTGASVQSSASMALPSRTNYGQPAPPAVADTNAQGRIQQPTNMEDEENMGKTFGSVPPKVAKMTFQGETKREGRGHKRSNTLGDLGTKIMGRSGSLFGRGKKRPEQLVDKSRKYPPVSLSNTMLPGEEAGPRPSIDSRVSRRSFSLGLGKKRSGSIPRSQGSGETKGRRFSLAKAMGLSKDHGSAPPSEVGSQADLPIQNPQSAPFLGYSAHEEPRLSEPYFDAVTEQNQNDRASTSPVSHQRYGSVQMDTRRPNAVPTYIQGSHLNTGSESSVDMRRPPTEPQLRMYQGDFSGSEGFDGRLGSSRGNKGVLHKNHKRFTDAYDQDDYRGHEGSSGAAKRVMDFFRRRAKARGGEER